MPVLVRALQLCLGLALLLLMPRLVTAQPCSTTTANANLSTVQNALNAAASGAVVCVPAGSATWSGTLTFPRTKDLTLKGAGVGQTIINCGGVNCLSLGLSSSHRLTGFEFNWTTGSENSIRILDQVVPGKVLRIDHNKFNSPNATWSIMNIAGETSAFHPTALIDNNVFVNWAVHVGGTYFMLAEGDYQHQLWATLPPVGHVGNGVGAVYVEENAFTSTASSGFQNFSDANYGGRRVWRFNTHTGQGVGVEIHSVQGANRAAQSWEIYGNTWSKSSPTWAMPVYARGGTGVIFDNSSSSNYTTDVFANNVRSCRDPGEGVGKCTGSSNWDGNSSGGYPCRDQIGRGSDAALWTPGAAYTQPVMPAYSWNNIRGTSTQWTWNIGAGESCPGGDLNPVHIMANRDFYNYTPAFNGTTGVGRGPIASRPATCTPGVAYWATDEGEWNSRQPGPDGQLYKCTAPNTWTLYYRPLTYPHPSQTGTVPAPPAAPTGLTVR